MIPKAQEIFELIKKAGDASFSLKGAKEERKSDGSDVSEADRASHRILIEGLAHYGYPILSEESRTFENLNINNKYWIIDPLDGTSDFLAGLSEWSIMVALLENNQPILGVVYAPEKEIFWSAEKGKGSFMHDKSGSNKLKVSDRDNVKESTMLMSAFHPSKLADDVAHNLGVIKKKQGSIGIKLGTIAQGLGELYFSPGKLGEWDVAAPQIILEEAGGRVSDMNNISISYKNPDHRIQNGIVASNTLLHEVLLKSIRDSKEK